MSALTPQSAAALLHAICEKVPTYEYGALGPHNALRLVVGALQHAELKEQAARLALLCWQDNPLNADLATLAGIAAPSRPSPLCQILARWCRMPEDAASLTGNFRALNQEQQRAHIQRFLPDPKHGGFWLRLGFEACLHSIDGQEHLAALSRLLADFAPQEVRAQASVLTARLRAEWALAHLGPQEALTFCRESMPDFAQWQAVRMALTLQKMRQRDEALAFLRPVWRFCPVHPNIILALHDILFPCPKPQGHTLPPVLALYSWNKAKVLQQSLQSLMATEAMKAPLLVLDNGSSDDTSALLTSIQAQWPVHAEQGGGMRIISLPVNVGAPAARNWLLTQEEVRQRQEIVFLDDDLILEHGWLDNLSAAACAHPEASVLGCQVVDHIPPNTVQCAEFFLLPEALGDRSFLDLEEKIFLHGGSMGQTDKSLTAHTRPCLSVSGCCHWLRLDERHGGPAPFDVRFNPSQFDDVERDMRLNLAGKEVVYVGKVSVKHVQHSSLRQAQSRSRSAHIFGNKLKLEHLFTPAQVEKIRAESAGRARKDLLRKITKISSGDRA